MFYCEKCLTLCDTNVCPHCDRHNLKTPTPNSFCLLTELQTLQANMLKSALENANIPCTYQSVNGAAMSLICFCQSFEKQRLFVPFEKLEQAKQIETELFENFDSENAATNEESLNENCDDDDGIETLD